MKAIIVGCAVALTASGAMADWEPTLSGEFQTRIQSDYTYRSKNKADKLSDTFTKTELEVELGLLQGFSLVGQL